MNRLTQTFLLALTLAATVSAGEKQLVRQWESEPSLKVPESVLFDAERQLLFVSNIDGTQPWEMDGAGSIAKVGLDGAILDAEWVSGLHAPKGMGLKSGQLYVADVERVVVIDVVKASITRVIEVPGAQRLNDISIDRSGVVYVSDSGSGKIHAIADGKASVYSEAFKSPNGVLAHEGVLFVLDQETLFRLGNDRVPEKVVENIAGHVDGIEATGDGAFVVSCWNGVVYYATPGHPPQKLLDTTAEKVNAADIGYNPTSRMVYVPTFWKNTVVAYELK